MLNATARDGLWWAVHTERAALAENLDDLDDAHWAQPSLCGRWVIEEVVAHLAAAASIGPLRWFASVLGARFDFDLDNERRLAEHRGATPAETLERSAVSCPAPRRLQGPPPRGWVKSSYTLRTSAVPSGSSARHRWELSPRSPASTPAATARC